MWFVLIVVIVGVFNGSGCAAKLPGGAGGYVHTPPTTVSAEVPKEAPVGSADPVVYGALYREQVEKLGQPLTPVRRGSYEDHTFTQVVTLTPTLTETVTKTHTLRIPSTSDVWVTSLRTVVQQVTQLATSRDFRPALPETVTSLIRVTHTKFLPSTVTVETVPTKTVVSVYTNFVTSTTTVDYWQPIVHYSTQYERVTRPVLENQTLLQRLFTTTTLVSYQDVTTTRRFQGW